MRISIASSLIPTWLLVFFPQQAHASASPLSHVKAQLVSDAESIEPGRLFTMGFHLKMQPGWHVYWVNPGDSGTPPRAQWELPRGFKAGEIQWPAPQAIELPPLMNYGYEGEVLLPVELTPPAHLNERSVTLKAQLKWLECKEVCIPGRAELAIELPILSKKSTAPIRPIRNEEWIKAFDDARLRTPAPISSDWSAKAALKDHSLLITLKKNSARDAEEKAFFANPKTLAFFPLQAGWMEGIKPQMIRASDSTVTLELARVDAGVPFTFEKIEGVIVNAAPKNGARVAYQIAAALEPRPTAAAAVDSASAPFAPTGAAAPSAAPAAHAPSSWLSLLFLAFLGGLILNLMPCVFPVLSLKVLSLLSHSGESKAKIRAQGLIFCAGVLVSFWALAAILLIARSAGQSWGWGFQLQSPRFVAGLILLFFLIGLNLLGVFEIGGRLAGAGSQLASRRDSWGSFFSGVLATVVATPCTAPFMGAAIGFALSQSATAVLLIFTAIALGMLLPYLALALRPQLLSKLPRPGAWMVTLKEFLAFPMWASALWLGWVLAQQAGIESVLLLLGILIIFSFGFWLSKKSAGLARWLGLALALALTAAFIAKMPQRSSQAAPHAPRAGWTPYSEQALAQALGQGKPVFVDFTAAWCLTCQVNARVALHVDAVERAFEEQRITRLLADWTSEDPTITRTLARFGRQGVPLYLLYSGKKDQAPLILPEILTPGIVLDYISKINLKTKENSQPCEPLSTLSPSCS